MNIIKLFLDYFGQLLNIFCPRKVFVIAKHIGNRIYTGYLRSKFKKIGNSIIMWHPYMIEGAMYIEIGNNTIVEPGIQLTARKINKETPKLKIGNNCLIRRNAHITAINEITIGNDVLTGTNIFITDNSHGNTDINSLKQKPTRREIISKGKVVVSNNVWIGNNVCILAGVTIGEGSIIGANSVVTQNVPPFSIAVGAPAKIIKDETFNLSNIILPISKK